MGASVATPRDQPSCPFSKMASSGCFETRSPCTPPRLAFNSIRLELPTLLPPPPKGWDSRFTLPSWVCTVLENEHSAHARHSTSEMHLRRSTRRSVCQCHTLREVQNPCREQTAKLHGERNIYQCQPATLMDPFALASLNPSGTRKDMHAPSCPARVAIPYRRDFSRTFWFWRTGREAATAFFYWPSLTPLPSLRHALPCSKAYRGSASF